MGNVGLTISRSGYPDQRLVLNSGVARLGRAEDNDICLPDIGVSRRHARIVVENGTVVFEDLGSGNGTWFRGKRIRSHSVSNGDELVIDPFTLCFELAVAAKASNEQTVLVGESASAATEEPIGARLEVIAAPADMPPLFNIPFTGVTIGRSEQRDIVVPDTSASRLHAEVLKVGEAYWVKDPGAANGLFVNGLRIREKELTDGDIVRIGSTEFRFTRLRAGKASPPESPSEKTEDFSGVMPAAPPPPAPPPSTAGAGLHTASTDHQPGVPKPQAGTPAAGLPFGGQQAARPVQQGGAAWGAQPGQPAPQAFGDPGQPFGQAGPGPGFGQTAVRPKAKGGVKPINLATGLIGLFIVCLLGFKVLRDLSSAPTVQPGPTTTERVTPSSDVSPDEADEIAALMDDGSELFQAQRYHEASRKFLRVLRLDPNDADAKRMGYLSCEFIVMRALRESVQRNAASDDERRQAKEEALALGKKALKGKENLSTARATVRSALNLNPGDKDLEDLDAKLRRKAGAVQQARNAKKLQDLEAEVAQFYNRGKKELDAGRNQKAISEFQKVLDIDSDRTTKYYFSAEDGIAKARENMRKAADKPYREGVAAMDAGNYSKARDKFQAALALDPSQAGAKAKLAEVTASLNKQALDMFNEGKVWETANQVDKALSAYSKCQKLLDDPSNPLHKKAQKRIDALLGM